jgi:ubiquinone biosynthesis protein
MTRLNSMNSRHVREREIAVVLMRHGMDYLVRAFGLERLMWLERSLAGHELGENFPTPPENLRRALEELGPTFVKLGQLLSTRRDLLPPDYQDELAKLQDAGPRVPGEVIRDTLEQELDGGEEAFGSFEPEPIAAASIGQAHAATLRDGTPVVVKVRRPGVVEIVEQDVAIMRNLAARASRRWEAAARYDVVGLADELADGLRAQLDYLQEGRNADRFAANFAGVADVQIPKVFWDLTTSRVITLERIDGKKITDLPALDAAGIDRHALAKRAAGVVGKMVFEDGFFHADPHPGNFFIQPSGRIGIIDFGLVGALENGLRERLLRLLIAFERTNPERLADALLGLGMSTTPVDRPQLIDDLRRLLATYSGRALGEIALGRAIHDLLQVVRRHRLRVPADLALLFEVIAVEEGITADLDRDFRFAEELAPYARPHILAQLSAPRARQHAQDAALDLEELAHELPGELVHLLDALSSGSSELHVRAVELERVVERVGNRIVRSTIAAAVIHGLAKSAFAAGFLRRKPRSSSRDRKRRS